MPGSKSRSADLAVTVTRNYYALVTAQRNMRPRSRPSSRRSGFSISRNSRKMPGRLRTAMS